MEFMDEFQQIAPEYNINPSQKQHYFQNITRKDEKKFYMECVQHYGTTFEQAVDIINQENNYPVRQTRVNN